MASGTTRPNGHQWVFFSYAGKRHTLRLGPITRKDRQEVERRLDRLIATKAAGLSFDPDLRQWLATLSARPHAVLARLGLAEERVDFSVTGLFTWHRKHLGDRGASPATLAVFDRVEDNCIAVWGASRSVLTITSSDADNLQAWLLASGHKNGGVLAKATVSRRLAMARQVFRAATTRGWLPGNPFAHIKRRGEVNSDRDEYVPWDVVEQLITVETTPEFKLLLAMARICGLRCPSELAPLPWSAIDWELGLLTIASPKTEVLGKSRRVMPIFAELEPHLVAAWHARQPATQIFPSYQGSATAITNRLARLCRKAKVHLWPKVWNNLRASAERDMLKSLPIDEVAAYLGHSPETALRHYSRVAKDLRASAESKVLRVPNLTWEAKRIATLIDGRCTSKKRVTSGL